MYRLLISLFIPVVALAQPTTYEIVFKPSVTVAAGSVTASFADAMTINDGENVKYVDIQNTADCTVEVAFGGSTAHYTLLTNTSLEINYGQMGKHISNNIRVRYSGSACTTGNVYISAGY